MDVAVVTVIPAELRAALLALGLDRSAPVKTPGGTNVFHGAVRSERMGRDLSIVVSCIGTAGTTNAAAATAALIAEFAPRVVLLMGIAAGIRGKVRIGDVVLSERVVAYEPAALVRSASGVSVQQSRAESDRVPYSILQDVVAYRAEPDRLMTLFAKAGGVIPTPASEDKEQQGAFREHVASAVAPRLGTIASGEKLLRDPTKLKGIRDKVHGKVDTGDMEAAGLVDACRQANVPWLVVRGISDFGDELKDDRFHDFAARAAAAVLVDFVERGLHLGGGAAPGTNPFILGRPIDREQDFVGRENEKGWILDAIEKGQPVQLLGESKMGKSSLLKWVARTVMPGRPVVEVAPMCDLTPASMVFWIAKKLEKEEAAAALTGQSPTSAEAAKVLNALVPFVLVMDDADALAERGQGFDVGFFAALRGHVQDRRLTWVSASRRDLSELFKERGLSSDFLNDAQKFWVGPLDKAASEKLLERGKSVNVRQVLGEAGGFAYGLQWLGDYLFRQPVTVEHACDAFESEARVIFRRWWGGLGVEDKQLMKRCLDGGVQVDALEKRLRQRLRNLVKRGLLAEREGRFVVEGEAWKGFVADAE